MSTSLHTHSCLSLGDSTATIEEIVGFAKENDHEAVCISDHGTLAAMIQSHKLARKAGIKCLTACEIYEVDDDEWRSDTKEYSQPRYHLLLIAKNNIGLHNLIQIVSYANTDGFYKKPRIDINRIKSNGWGEGLICCTACQAGRLSKYLTQKMEEEAWKYADDLCGTFDNVYCEIQSHNTPEQAKANRLIYDFAIENDLPYVITTDAHMIRKEDMKYHSMFVEAIGHREVGEAYIDCYMQTDSDIYNTLGNQFTKGQIKKGIEATTEIADMCEQVDVGLDNDNQMPHIDVPDDFFDSEDYLRYLCYKTFNEKFGHMNKEEQQKRKDRIEMEIPVLVELDFVDYLIMLSMIADECRKRDIPLGYSRGSGGNCLCLYMLNVTQIDSVRWDLDFSRFANIGRKGTLADYDFDVSKIHRTQMLQVFRDLFGEENVCNISTYNTFTNKVAIKDLGKVFNDKPDSPYFGQIPQELRDHVAKIIPVIKVVDENGEEIEKDVALKDAIKGNEELENLHKKYPAWFDSVIHLSGLPKSRGCHASAIMITPKPVTEYCSICNNKDGEVMYEDEMHSLMDDIKLIKMDCLGLKNLSVVDMTLNLSGLTWSDVDINTLNLKDEAVYNEIYKTGYTAGVFQMESLEARRMLIAAKADNIEDIIVVNSANRPGTKESFPDYCHNKLHPEDITVIHDDLKEIFKQSHSVLLYQEQALALLRYAGFPEEEVETGRKAIGKKLEAVMRSLKKKFKNGLKERGWLDEQIETIWKLLKKQSEYCFNRGHAVAYSLLSYLTAYLKTHYPIEYMTASLSLEEDKEKSAALLNELKRMGMKLDNPDINLSSETFTPDKENNRVLYGLGFVKGLSSKGYEAVMNNRPYSDFEDFLDKVYSKVDISDVNALIKAGAFGTECKIDCFRMYYTKRFWDKKIDRKIAKHPIKNAKKAFIEEAFKLGLTTPENKDNKELVVKCINQYRLENGWEVFKKKYCEGNELEWEMETLNTFLSGDPFEGVFIPNWDNVKDDEDGWLGGVIVNVKDVIVKNGKNKGQKMCFVNLDINGEMGDLVVFSNNYSKFSDILKNGKCVVCRVTKDASAKYKGIIQGVSLLSKYLEQTKTVQQKRGKK
ncbi:DNA polymerase III subunit alpha [[Clostridium] innocuum]|nr:DNA polymerase III subunit alpha [[Clostridium] innocuum]